jgi:hypothetical protein
MKAKAMLTRSFPTLWLCVLTLGCGDPSLDDTNAKRDDSSESTDPVDAEPSHADLAYLDTAADTKRSPADEPMEVKPDAEPVLDHAPVWKDTSARIRIETRNYWLGGMKYERAVEDLSDEQLELLRGLARTRSDPDFCVYDALEATVTVEDADGSAETFELEQAVCHYEGVLLTAATLKPFLHTLACVTRGPYGFSRGGRFVPASETPVLGANDGCTHGLYGASPAMLLDVTDSRATYTLESLECYGRDVQIALYDETQQTLLGRSEAVPDGCSTLSYQFAATGRYALQLEGKGGYSLRVSAE